MTTFIGHRPGVSGLVLALLLAAAQPALADGQASEAARPASEASVSSARDLIQQINAGGVVGLRKTSNGSYEAQLLFDRQTRAYFVALLQRENYWRVIKTNDQVRAEANYTAFAKQTERLSDAEMQRLQAEIQKSQVVQRLLTAREKERRLTADVDLAQEQATLAAEHGREARSEIADLTSQQKAVESELKETMERIAKLERQEKSSATRTR